MSRKELYGKKFLGVQDSAFLVPGVPFTTVDVEVEAGTGVVYAGTVLAVKTSTGKVTPYKKTGSDGENEARYILASKELDWENHKIIMVYDMGTFFIPGLVFPSDFQDTDIDKAKKELAKHKLYLTRSDI